MTTTARTAVEHLARPHPFAAALTIPAVIRPAPGEVLRIRMRTATHRFHPELPASRVWAYEGTVPGPTIEVPRDQPVRVEWHNELEGTLPLVATVAPEAPMGEIPTQCLPGRSGGAAIPEVSALPPWTSVHLHGAATPAQSDGWTENTVPAGHLTVCDYPMRQRGTLLWYHDHCMGATKYMLYAGLAGLWIIRDERERELGLPVGAPYEIPLLLADRNVDLDADGGLTGRLLHKTDTGTMECFGPYTTVNGTIWPYHEVEPCTYRLRVLNASNARTYRLVLLDPDGELALDRIRQIGSDGGLLREMVALPADGLILASGERADLAVDFAGLPPGARLQLLNTADSPFDGTPLDPATRPGRANVAGLLPFPEVMEFRVGSGEPRTLTLPTPLTSDFDRLTREALSSPVHRTIAFVEQERDGEPNMLTMRELARVDDPQPGEWLITVTERGERTHRRTLATRFEDRVTIFPAVGRDEIWRLINLTDDTHPFHVHQIQFQALARFAISHDVPDGGIADTTTTATVRFAGTDDDPELDDPELDDTVRHDLDANEMGLKDTVRLNGNEVLDVALRFGPWAGRYMYHCHILEHSDRDMMRPFVVTPPELMSLMGMPER